MKLSFADPKLNRNVLLFPYLPVLVGSSTNNTKVEVKLNNVRIHLRYDLNIKVINKNFVIMFVHYAQTFFMKYFCWFSCN